MTDYTWMECHWLGENNEDKDEECLVSFDLSNEVFFPTHFPLDIPSHMYDSFDFHVVRRQLVLLNESIVLISNYADTNICYTLILGELGVKESWTKFFIVGPLAFIGEPIGVGKKDEIFFRKKDGEIARFHVSTHVIEEKEKCISLI